MYSYNRAMFIGYLARDPEVKYLPSGNAVANFSIGVNRTWKDPKTNEKKEECSFFNCTAWGKTAENIGKYLTKGKPVFIEGHLRQETWEKDGEKRSAVKVVVDTINFLGTKDGEAKGAESAPAHAEPDMDPDEIPF